MTPFERFEPQREANNWLLSFGDLLTLLFSAFIVLLTSTPLHGVIEQPEAGTGFANHTQQTLDSVLVLTEQDFVQAHQGLKSAALERVKSFLESRAYASEAARFALCSHSTGGTEWDELFERVESVSRQLSDSAAAVSGIETELLGSHCERLQVFQQDAVAVFAMKDLQNG